MCRVFLVEDHPEGIIKTTPQQGRILMPILQPRTWNLDIPDPPTLTYTLYFQLQCFFVSWSQVRTTE